MKRNLKIINKLVFSIIIFSLMISTFTFKYNGTAKSVQEKITETQAEVSFDSDDNWKQVDENENIYYVRGDGTTSTIINGNDIYWLKEDSVGQSTWYGIDNSSGVFKNGSRFWVRWLSKDEDEKSWSEYYNDFDDKYQKSASEDYNDFDDKYQKNVYDSEVFDKSMYDNKSSDNQLKIFLIGVTSPDGTEYSEWGDVSVPVLVQLGDSWDKDNIKAVFISHEKDESVGIKFLENVNYPGGVDSFARIMLNHFSPYAVYDTPNIYPYIKLFVILISIATVTSILILYVMHKKKNQLHMS